jgi:protein involved in polysaccharide export with SLBB domain
MRPRKPSQRALALFLACQPVIWMSDVALAQSVLDGLSGARERGADEPRPSDVPSDVTDTSSLVPPGTSSPAAPGGPAGGDLFTSGATATPGTSPALPPGRPPPLDAPLDPDSYVCGPGDVLDLNFWGIQNYRHRLTVDLEGRLFVPKLGHYPVKGNALSEVRRTLREAVARSYPRLKFDVTLVEPRTFLVQVVDAVGRPGAYATQATDRVATVIDRAGGLARNGSRRRIEIRRSDGAVLHADLLRYAQTGDTQHNPRLLDGDVVRVPFEAVAASIEGAVNRPGRYELVGSRDLAELLDLAGGLAPTATRRLPLSVVRRQPDERQAQELVALPEDGPPPAIALHHEDVVRVPGVAELQRSLTVSGAVAGAASPEDPSATRRVPFVEGDTVRTLLDRVGGVGPSADLPHAYILRDGAQLPVDLHALLALRRTEADRPLALGDTLVVPFGRRSVRVQGAVLTPGLYPYNPGFGIEQYVAAAGGPSKNAQGLSSVRVITPDGRTRTYEKDLAVPAGSSVVLPERGFSRAEIVQVVISAASVLVSSVAVYISARR